MCRRPWRPVRRPWRTSRSSTARDLGLIDAHNHDTADGLPPQHRLWERNRIAGVVLFGNVSEPRSVHDDRRTLEWYRNHPEYFIPFFSGFDPYDRNALDVVRPPRPR